MKHTLSIENIWKFRKENKLKQKDLELLVEAYRRKHFLKGAALSAGWVGLGTPSEYKSVFFRSHDGDTTPRISHWWKLTKEGEEMMQKMEAFFDLPKNADSSHKMNSELFFFLK